MTMSVVHSLSTSYGITVIVSPSRDLGMLRPSRPRQSPLARSQSTSVAPPAGATPPAADRSDLPPTLSAASRFLRDCGRRRVFRGVRLWRRRASLFCRDEIG